MAKLFIVAVVLVVAAAPSAAQQCHPEYVGACVPTEYRDVDCLGGQGNGPGYPDRMGPFESVGSDPYDLDTDDDDNLACEPPRR